MEEFDVYDGCGLIQFDSPNKVNELMIFKPKTINEIQYCISPFDFKKYIDFKIKSME